MRPRREMMLPWLNLSVSPPFELLSSNTYRHNLTGDRVKVDDTPSHDNPAVRAAMISLVEFVTLCGAATLSAAGISQGLNCLRHPRSGRSANPVRSSAEDGSGRPDAGAWHEPRYGKRYRVNCRIQYEVGGTWNEGVLIDMSRQGWRARGAQPVPNGTTLAVQVYFDDCIEPIRIDEALVRWTEGVEFGVELTRISPASAATFSDYLSTHYPVTEPTKAYALSPFSYN